MISMELAVDYERCQGSHIFSTVNGAVRPPHMSQDPPVLIVDGVDSAWEDTEICIGLKGTCDTLESLCYDSKVCWYVLFGNEDCCYSSKFEV